MLNEELLNIGDLGENDSSRLCPMFAGPALIDKEQLTVRLADGDISIRASQALLRKVFALCDGTRSIDELSEAIVNASERDHIRSFIEFLLESGALIDASHYSLMTTRFAWGGSPFGQPAEPGNSERISKRFTAIATSMAVEDNIYPVNQAPLAKQFAERVSTYTFGEQAVKLEDLNTLLWSMAGIVDEHRQRGGAIVPRRTLASAGAMHLVEVYVVLQKRLKSQKGHSISPGIYRIQYPSEHAVQYKRISADVSLLPRTVEKPWCLSFSTGMIFLAADARLAGLRYRNRSIQYLFTEAGMALQNGSLTAPELGLGFVSFGSYYEGVVRQICGLSDHLILGAAIFGSAPTKEQIKQVSSCPQIEFAWADAPSEKFTLPYYVGRAKLKYGSSDRPTWGRDTDPALACRKAIAETIERQGYREPRDLQRATFLELEQVIDPRLVVRFSNAQYKTTGFPCKRFSPETSYLWAKGKTYGSESTVSVLADLVYSPDSLHQIYGQDSFYWKSNSSGCAAGTTMADARLAALLELIERDAFMRHWLMQSPGTEIAPDSLPSTLQKRVNAIADAGFEVIVQVLPSPWAPVAFFFAKHRGLRATCVSAGARLILENAIDSALVELESRIFSLLNGIQLGKLKPKEVLWPDDHFALYARARYFDRADRLSTPSNQIRFNAASKKDLTSPGTLFEQMLAAGITPIFVDITPRLSGICDGRENLAVARAFAPGLLPMSFGYGMEPRGMVERVHPASLFPHPFP